MLIISVIFTTSLHVVSLPFDNGANVRGSRYSPTILVPMMESHFPVQDVHFINMKQQLRLSFGEAFLKLWHILEDHICVNIGGDHTVAIATVFASNAVCRKNHQSLGVLWLDAHADFNTPQTSLTQNLHGMPVATLVGHCLPVLSFGESLETSQFGYFGVRDVDEEEQNRLNTYNMKTLHTCEEVEQWMTSFDKVHVSFDCDCITAQELPAVSTPVPDGPSLACVGHIFDVVRKSGKLMSVDIVEYNPDYDDENNTSANVIVDLMGHLFRRKTQSHGTNV